MLTKCRYPHLIATAFASLLIILLGGCTTQKPPLTKPKPITKVKAAIVTFPPPVILKATAPIEYVIQKGDTLWGIAQYFLRNPWAWPEIWYANPQIKNPHWIYPGDILTLYYVNGKPRISVTGGPRIQKTVVLKPEIGYQKLPETKTPIPIQTIRPFLIKSRVVSQNKLLTAPHIVGTNSSQILYADGMKVYVRGLPKDSDTSMYSVYRPGKPLKSPQTKRIIAYQAIYLGDIRIVHNGLIATGVLENVTNAVQLGDRLLPYVKQPENYTFLPRAPRKPVYGQVISLFNAIAMVGQYQVIVLDVGTQQGIRRGDVLQIKQRGRLIHDRYATINESPEIRLPNTHTGLAMVFQPYKRISYALIMSATHPIEIGDIITNP